MPIFCKDSLDCQHAHVQAAKVKLADTARRRPAKSGDIIDRRTGRVTAGADERGAFAVVTGFIAAHPVATAAITFGLMAAFGPLRLIRLGLIAGRGVGMVMAAKKAAQSVDILS